jgi:hypothetical protein
MIVAPLYYMGHNNELAFVPSAEQMGIALDPCTQNRQRPWAERSDAFRSLPFGNHPNPYDPDRAGLSDAELLELGTGPLDIQRGAGATLMLSTFHLAGGWATRGRDIELALAGIAVRHFRQQRIDEPPRFAVVPVRREIYATVAVRVEDLLSPRARQSLADAYLALAPDGFWVKIADFDQRASLKNIRAAGGFLWCRPTASGAARRRHLGKYRARRERALHGPRCLEAVQEGRQAAWTHTDGVQRDAALVVPCRLARGDHGVCGDRVFLRTAHFGSAPRWPGGCIACGGPARSPGLRSAQRRAR